MEETGIIIFDKMKRFEYIFRQCDPNGQYQWAINTSWIANSGIEEGTCWVHVWAI